jgi:predicted nucleic acid-binding protein
MKPYIKYCKSGIIKAIVNTSERWVNYYITWDNYPIAQFPGLWDWLAAEVKAQRLSIASVALEEVGHKAPGCATWLKNHDIRRLPMSNDVLQAAMSIKQQVGIRNDKYHPKGVDENDILIIAAAQHYSATLITNEKRQLGKQNEPTKRKIPAVCDLPGVSVAHKNFLDYIRKSEQVF